MSRPLPQAIDMEKGLLSSMIQSEKAISRAIEAKIEGDAMHHPAHKTIWKHIMRMHGDEKPIDLLTLTESLESAGELDNVGGAHHIAELYTFVPTWTNWQYYAEIVARKWQARRAILEAENILAAAYDPAVEDCLAEVVQAALVRVASFSQSSAETTHIRDVVIARLDYYETVLNSGGKLRGIGTGIEALDRVTGGFKPGQVVTIAAKTKDGKTSLAMNIGDHAADTGNAVGIFSMEMTKEELTDRFVSSRSKVDFSKAHDGGFTAYDVTNLRRAALHLADLGIYIRDESVLTPAQFRAAAVKLVAQNGCKLLIVDYVQLFTPTNDKESREAQVAKASRTIKTTAQDLGVPIIVLSQLNDDGRSRESRAIENDSNIFMVIESQPVYAEGEKTPQKDERGEDLMEFFIRIKYSRDCPKARVPVTFKKDHTRFYERITHTANK